MEIPSKQREGRLRLGRRRGDNKAALECWYSGGWREVSPCNWPMSVLNAVVMLSVRLRRPLPLALLSWLERPRPEHPWQGFEAERWLAVAVELAEASAL